MDSSAPSVDEFAIACGEDPPSAERMLKDQPELVGARNEWGETALYQVVSQYSWWDPDAIAFLIRNGADVNVPTSSGHWPLHAAVCAGNPKVVKLLIEAGANTNARDECNLTPILHIDHSTDVAVVDLLLNGGADAFAVDDHGEGLLHVAARNGRMDVLERGLKMGLNPSAVSSTGATPYDLAVVHKHWDAMRFLRDL